MKDIIAYFDGNTVIVKNAISYNQAYEHATKFWNKEEENCYSGLYLYSGFQRLWPYDEPKPNDYEEFFVFPIGDPPNTKYFTGELEDNWSEFKN